MSTSESGRQGIDILVVEDSRTQAEYLRQILKRHGHRVHLARNGREALDAINGSRPSCIISDVIMPEMDGYELCRHLKEDPGLRFIPLLLVTSLSDPVDVVRGLECGADDFINKPIEERHLISRVNYLLANAHLYSGEQLASSSTPIEIAFAGRKFVITSDRVQILTLLLSTYEMAVQKNLHLARAQEELRHLNATLEQRVKERTAALVFETAQRQRSDEELRLKTAELEEMSRQFWQAGRLSTLGELAASIAHELNNPLGTVSLRIESLQAELDDEPKRRELKVIEGELDRMSNLVAGLLQFSRRGIPQFSTTDVQEEINNSLDLLHYHMRNSGVRVVREAPAELPEIQADRQKLRQLFLNLLINACDAMPEGGVITIRLAVLTMGNGEPGICIDLVDTGVGISTENLARVMEPFFTTKKEGKGTGLGLPICKRIVEEHSGTLELCGEPDRGTTVRIVLPVTVAGNICE